MLRGHNASAASFSCWFSPISSASVVLIRVQKSWQGTFPIKDWRKEPKQPEHLALTAGTSELRQCPCVRVMPLLLNLDNWYWEHVPRPAMMKTVCVPPCIGLENAVCVRGTYPANLKSGTENCYLGRMPNTPGQSAWACKQWSAYTNLLL